MYSSSIGNADNPWFQNAEYAAIEQVARDVARNARHAPLAASDDELSKQGEDRMDNHCQENGNNAEYVWGFLAGLLVGGLAGAVAMLFLAPQSGKETRAQIRQKSIEVRDQTIKTMEDGVAQSRGKARQITDDVREQAGELQQRGQDMLDEQRGNLSKTLKGLGKAVKP